ncbi:Ni/Fe hydrogenase subunit gamma [candidate division KSB1 bacterium]|nr:MAG: Ni/Fe hydrogenase subunit gamma [candidate division KSB1 bacterium]
MASVREQMTPLPFRVKRTVQETHDTFTLELEPAGGKSNFAFAAGQFNMLYAFGVGEVPISISGDPGKSQALVHTTRAVGHVTEALRKLKKGDLLGIRGPFGSSWPITQARGCDVVLVAGGIGLAPLRPAFYHILSHREEYGQVALLYGTRTPQDMLYERELEQWRGRFDVEVGITVDRATTGWKGSVGVVTRLISKAPFDPHTAIAMVCGPEIMMRYAIMELQKRGVADSRIYLSMERNMKCGIGLCGHCQFGPTFVCKDGPVYSYDSIRDWLRKREI